MKDNINHNPPLPDDRAGKVQEAREIVGRLMNSPTYFGIPTVYRGVQMRSRLEAMRKAGFQRELLLLGLTPWLRDDRREAYIGWLGEMGYGEAGEERWYEPAVFGESAGGYDFCHEQGSYRCRLFGGYTGSPPSCSWRRLEAMWAAASNATQWRPPSGR